MVTRIPSSRGRTGTSPHPRVGPDDDYGNFGTIRDTAFTAADLGLLGRSRHRFVYYLRRYFESYLGLSLTLLPAGGIFAVKSNAPGECVNTPEGAAPPNVDGQRTQIVSHVSPSASCGDGFFNLLNEEEPMSRCR